jgi:hypothetical protein
MSRLTSVPQTHPPGAGWRDWLWLRLHPTDPSPYQHVYVEAWRQSWQCVEVLRVTDLRPEFNVAGLWWRAVQSPVLEPEVRPQQIVPA